MATKPDKELTPALLEKRRKSAELDEQILQLYLKGRSYNAIASALSTTVGTVANRVRRMSHKGMLTLRGRTPKSIVRVPSTPTPPRPVDSEAASSDDGNKGSSSNTLSPGAVAVHDIQPHQCRWPIGDVQNAGFRFCCKPRVYTRLGRSVPDNKYCEEHTLEGYVKASYRRRSR